MDHDLLKLLRGPERFFADSVERQWICLLQLTCALLFLHRSVDRFHRDIKPGNVLCSRVAGNKFVFKLADFGQAVDGALELRTATRTLAGTEMYMAPEQSATGQSRYSNAVDWWSLGCLGFDLVYGEYFQPRKLGGSAASGFDPAQTPVFADPGQRYADYAAQAPLSAKRQVNRVTISERRHTQRADHPTLGTNEAMMDALLGAMLTSDSTSRKNLTAAEGMLCSLFEETFDADNAPSAVIARHAPAHVEAVLREFEVMLSKLGRRGTDGI
jgi:serine/threonine protein kinase